LSITYKALLNSTVDKHSFWFYYMHRTFVCFLKGTRTMSELKEVFAAYKKLSFTDRIVFYTTLSNTVNVHEDNIQDFLIETRICERT